MEKPRIYLATPISGKGGVEGGATIEDMERNCLRAKRNVEVLKIAEPRIRWICVAPHNAAVSMHYEYGHLDVEEIMEVDFGIVDMCPGLLAHFWEPSAGAEREYARKMADRYGVAARLEGPPEIWKCDWKIIDTLVERVLSLSESSIRPNYPNTDWAKQMWMKMNFEELF